MKNKIKEFFKPTVLKVVIFIVLLFLTIFISKSARICGMTQNGVFCGENPAQGIGYPMFLGTKYSGDVGGIGIYPVNLLINIIIYYFISSGIVTIIKLLRIK